MKKSPSAIRLAMLVFGVLAALTFTWFSNPVGAQKKAVESKAKDRSYDVTSGDTVMYPIEGNEQLDKTFFERLEDLWNNLTGKEREDGEENDADLPKFAHGKISKAEYLKLRGEYISRIRGIEPGEPFDTTARARAIGEMQKQQDRLIQLQPQGGNSPLVAWNELGPFSLPNGQTQTGATAPVDGRITAIAVDPTDSNYVYLATAQGGVWRSTNGGTNWTSIFDNAQSLAIGAIAIAPSNPNIIYIGTGEPNLCADCFFGIGLYRIDNARTTTGAASDLIGPINPAFSFTTTGGAAVATTVFGGRTVSQIVIDETNPANIWVGTSTGSAGSGGNGLSSVIPPVALLGVYRSTNATSAPAAITFQKLAVDVNGGSLDAPATGNRRISDLALEPGNPDVLLVGTFGAGAAGDGGIFRSTNARAANPTFTQNLIVSAQRIRFAISKSAGNVTVLAATSETPTTASCSAAASQQGVLRRSVDGGVTWLNTNAAGNNDNGIIPSAGGFCGGQCFYNVTVAVNPLNSNDIYLGGNARGTCSDAMQHATDGFNVNRDDVSLHADSHALAFSSDGTVIFAGNDGGVWKRAAQTAGVITPNQTPWTDLNTAPLNVFQFVSGASHPRDRSFMIGGTQDNGTQAQTTNPGNWISAEGGDGGYALIDQSSPDATNTTAYHTFYNQANSLIGFDRMTNSSCLAVKDSWVTRGNFGGSNDLTPGCDGTANYIKNGIVLSDNVLFYAPMALGPGTPNTVYFGTTRLYRSADRGDTMPIVSQVLSGTATAGSPISTIGIESYDDNYRIVGLQNGKVFGTSTGSSTLVDITSASFPANPASTTNKFVGRAQFDPTNETIAYVTFSYYAPAGQGIWKITNFDKATNATPVAPVWTPAANGIPSIPINALVIDPLNGNNLFAGTDIGVYYSTNGGANWAPYGTGLPRVSVFDLSIQPTNRLLRAATHGRGMFEIGIPSAPTAATATVSGRALTSTGRGVRNVVVTLTDSTGKVRKTVTGDGGSYHFNDVVTGETYVIRASARKYEFTRSAQSVNVNEDTNDLNFVSND